MSDTAKRLFEGVRDTIGALAPGIKNFVPEVGAEFKRLGVHGDMELASALFTGDGFVPYGPGQYTEAIEPEKGQEQVHEQEMGLER